MSKRFYFSGLAFGLLYLGAASAQYPIMDKIAERIIQKYQASSCEQLYQEKAPKLPQARRSRRPSKCCTAMPRCAQLFLAKSRLPSLTRCSNAG